MCRMLSILQEYPLQLISIRDNDRLEKFLVNWNVFDELFDIEYSGLLINYWRTVSKMFIALVLFLFSASFRSHIKLLIPCELCSRISSVCLQN